RPGPPPGVQALPEPCFSAKIAESLFQKAATRCLELWFESSRHLVSAFWNRLLRLTECPGRLTDRPTGLTSPAATATGESATHTWGCPAAYPWHPRYAGGTATPRATGSPPIAS